MKVFARFLTSAVSPAHFPTESAPEIAFLGRSNVGKSSLLNSLTGAKLARVSNTPGRTQTINFFGVDLGKPKPEPELIFSDLPGYGYARVPIAIVGEWPTFIEPYLAEREALKLCICLVDSNIPPQKSDAQLIEWLEKNGRAFIVVATKTDRMSGNELAKSLKALTNEFGVKPLTYSAKTGKGRDDLWRAIRATVSSEE
ncbi:MAG TPA: ribosome biogenesis GTP-binding protein YihA/YsxC [Terriglobales bacterium]|nr:ribosome biogenesis GTP-binding protein YihA/YsxC [Terriglobales bacterium]